MNEARRRLIQGAVIGSFVGAGAVFMLFWHILTSGTNAGAMVEGEFRSYQTMTEWHILLGGGLILFLSGITVLALTWRNIGKAGS